MLFLGGIDDIRVNGELCDGGPYGSAQAELQQGKRAPQSIQ